jgi:hypothetical protein
MGEHDDGEAMLAEQLVGEARARHPRGMNPRERRVLGISAALFLLAALAIAAFIPSEREFQPLLLVGLVAGYSLISRVRFEVGNWFIVPETLVFVPLVLLAPLPLVPLLVALASVLSVLPELLNGSWHKERAVTCLSDCWFSIGPVLMLAWLAPGEPWARSSPSIWPGPSCATGSSTRSLTARSWRTTSAASDSTQSSPRSRS